MSLLEYAKNSDDLWSNLTNNTGSIQKEELLFALFAAHKQIKDIKRTDKENKKANRYLRKYIEENTNYSFIQNSQSELYKEDDGKIEIMFYCNGEEEIKTLIGQAQLYKYYINQYYKGYVEAGGYKELLSAPIETTAGAYRLQVEVLAEAIQATGWENPTNTSDTTTAVYLAWGHNFKDGTWN